MSVVHAYTQPLKGVYIVGTRDRTSRFTELRFLKGNFLQQNMFSRTARSLLSPMKTLAETIILPDTSLIPVFPYKSLTNQVYFKIKLKTAFTASAILHAHTTSGNVDLVIPQM